MHALSAPAGAALYTLFFWWFATGAVFWLQRRGALGKAKTVGLAAGLCVAGLVLARISAVQASPLGAAEAFTAALAIWGGHELSFLSGVVTGPNRDECPAGARGVERFRKAAATLIFHEAALAATLLVLVVVDWGQPNPVAVQTFLTLFLARLCAKLNLFSGVPSFSAGLFPEPLRHMASYLRRRPASPLLELTLAGLALVTGLEAGEAFAGDASPFRATAFGLLFALTALALLEHLFMLWPVPETLLWGWALRADHHRAAGAPAEPRAVLRPGFPLRRHPKGVSVHGL